MYSLPEDGSIPDHGITGTVRGARRIKPLIQEVESPGLLSQSSYQLYLSPGSGSQLSQIPPRSEVWSSAERSTQTSEPVSGASSYISAEDIDSHEFSLTNDRLSQAFSEEASTTRGPTISTFRRTGSEPTLEQDSDDEEILRHIGIGPGDPGTRAGTIHKRVTIARRSSSIELWKRGLEILPDAPVTVVLPPEEEPKRELIGQVEVPGVPQHAERKVEAIEDPADGIAPVIEVAQASNVVHSDPSLHHVDQSAPDAHSLLVEELEGCVASIAAKPRPDATDPVLRRSGLRKILFQKHAVQVSQLAVNALCIFATWWWFQYYYILLPFIMATVALNVIMIFDLVVVNLIHLVWPVKVAIPENPETLVLLIPCYNETKEELLKSLNSLADQQGIDEHKRVVMIVVDGKVRGPGMQKTTANYLLDDILTDKTERKYLKKAYLAWDQQYMDIVMQRGSFRGLSYFCIVKQQNQGKRDGLIVVRSFLYNFNIRHQKPNVIFGTRFFADMAAWLLESGIDKVDCLIGMDADTTFDENCISNLLQESRYGGTVGVCGYVAVDWTSGNWNVWRLYQSAEYTVAQCLRRVHQSTVTKKVSCLPGCCQLLKICEETCGETVLMDKFGYCPTVQDGLLKHIRATASEDRNHVCHMLTARPQSQTRQALAARAITDVPHSWSVFLSQRRRWTLGATSNDLMLVFARGTQWFERITATVNVITWFLNPFIIASLGSFFYACVVVDAWVVLCFVGIMLIPVVYYLCIPLWLPMTSRERAQFWVGCWIYMICGPFLNIAVLLYASWYMDSFGWGKTRKVISEDTPDEMVVQDAQTGEKIQDGAPDALKEETLTQDRVQATMDAEKSIGR